MAKLNDPKEDDCIDFGATGLKTSFDHSYLVSKFDQTINFSPKKDSPREKQAKKNSVSDAEFTSTALEKVSQMEKAVNHYESFDYADSPKMHHLSSTSIASKDDVAAEPKFEAETKEVYKTPNYKNKRRTSTVYVTKHGAHDQSSHDELMKKKYGVKLSVRKDVVNKTLFRALKRFYTEKFESVFALDKKESTSSYMSKVHQFVEDYFKARETELESWGVTVEEIEKLMLVIVSPNHIKSALTEESDLVLYKDYYSCIYQYSHKKLANMLLRPVCGYLFADFINSGNLTAFIHRCSTMSLNPGVYEKAGANFMNILLGKDKKFPKSFAQF